MWLFNEVGQRRRPIINYSGGTEVAGGLLGCTVFRPIKPCGFNTAVPGVEAVVLDESGKPVADAVGELAVLNAWPGMTNGFWQDPQRYLDTYWSRFDNIWVHGDWAMRDGEDHWYLLGRSDDTLKIAGKRLGPAEVEAAAGQCEGVKESAAVGLPHATKGETPVLFVVLLPASSRRRNAAVQLPIRSRRRWASRCGRKRSTSCRTCRAPATPKLCGGCCAPFISARNQAIYPAWRIRQRWRRFRGQIWLAVRKIDRPAGRARGSSA
jgi:acyl-coenzyme A synthetase/AMP-(fatty) acid ligase